MSFLENHGIRILRNLVFGIFVNFQIIYFQKPEVPANAEFDILQKLKAKSTHEAERAQGTRGTKGTKGRKRTKGPKGPRGQRVQEVKVKGRMGPKRI